MAVNVTTAQQGVETETALLNLNITRGYPGGNQWPGMPVAVPAVAPALTYGVNLTYGANKLILAADGSIDTVVSQGQNQVMVNFTQAQVGGWMLLPITVDGVVTTLVAYIESLADAVVSADLAAKAALAAAQAAAAQAAAVSA
jgi:hypothetical protein